MIEEGIYFGLPEADYHAAPGLSMSGMKALAVSPQMYHHQFIAKEAEEPTDAARFGSLVHCRLLEPKRFSETYAVPPSIDAYPGALSTKEHLIAWLEARHQSTKHKVKADLITRVLAHSEETKEEVFVWDAIKDQWARENEGKLQIADGEAERIRAIAKTIAEHGPAKGLLSGGIPEVSFFVRDPNTDVLLKARLDFVRIAGTIDVKTFGRRRGETPADAVARAIYWEGYYRQGVFYRWVRDLCRMRLKDGDLRVHGSPGPDFRLADWLDKFAAKSDHAFAFVFVEADAPHHVVLRELRHRDFTGSVNLYWDDAETFVEDSIEKYAECVREFGEKPWREIEEVRILSDLDMPGLVFKKPKREEQA